MTKEKFLEFIKTNNKKQVIFDFDQTLCTLLIDWGKWEKDMKDLFNTYEVELNPEEVSYAAAENYCIEKFGDEARNKILEINRKHETESFSGYDLHKITLELLESLSKFATLHLWTSNDSKTIMPILKELDIEKYFEKIVTRNDVKYIKPSADGFIPIHDCIVPKSEYILIGDSEADSGAAENAGIDFLNISEIEF